MSVVIWRSAPRCKICSSSYRNQIDALLEQAATGKTDPAGVKITRNSVLVQMGEWGIPNPTLDNITSHWGSNPNKRHSYYDKPKSVEEMADAEKADFELTTQEVDRLLADVFGDETDVASALANATMDDTLELVRRLGALDMVRRAREGKSTGVTVDQMLKAVAEATKRRSNEVANTLLGNLAAGMAAAFKSSGELERKPEKIGLAEQNPEDAEYEIVE